MLVLRYLFINLLFAVFLLVIQISAFQNDLDYDGILSVKLEHALNHQPNAVFTDRGSVTVQSVRTGIVALQQIALTSASKQELKKLSKEEGFYRIRSSVRMPDGKETSFLSFVKACALIHTRLSDILTISLDHTGAPVSISLATSPTLCEGEDIDDEDLSHFNTTVFVRLIEQGPIPDTASYIQKLEREKEARDRGEVKDNRSFLAKYWMYIVPVVIFVVLSGASNPDGGAAAGGGR